MQTNVAYNVVAYNAITYNDHDLDITTRSEIIKIIGELLNL